MLFAELAATSKAVGATRSRSAKIQALAACLRALTGEAESESLAAGVCFLAGRLRQGRLGVGNAAVRRLRELPAAATSSLTVGEVDRALAEFERQRPRRADRLQPLVRRASADERDYLLRLLIGEVRQGALDGLLVDAIAVAAEAPLDRVRRALMVSGDLPAVAEAALRDGGDGLQAFQLQVFQPVEPMLAQSAPSVAEALGRTGAAAVEVKLDGMRVQIHRDGDAVRVFTRSLRDVTAGVPAAVAAARRLCARSAVVDGEAIALGAEGRPRPFQETMSAAGRVSIFLFDCLFLDGRDLTGEPWSERRQALTAICPAELRLRHAWQDLQGHDRRGAALADRAAAATGDAARGPRRPRAAGAGRRDRRRRHPDQSALPGRHGAALRPPAPLSGGQDRRPGRHRRYGAAPAPARRSRNEFGYFDLVSRSSPVDKVATGSHRPFMRAVGIKALKNRLSEYVRVAASGETVLVTDRDRIVAELGPPRETRSPVLADAVCSPTRCVRAG